jgi:hypothetical protein
METKKTNWLLIIASVVIGIVLFVVVAGVLYMTFKPTPSTPVVTIHSPAGGDQVGIGELIAVNSTSRDEDHQIVKVELWEVEGEQMRLVGVDEPIEPAGVFSVPQGWQPLSAGAYRLTVRAFNDQGDYGQAAVDVEVVEMPEGAAEVALAEGETLPAPGGFDLEGAGEFDNTIPPPEPEPELPFDPYGFLVDPILEHWGDFIVFQDDDTYIEIEALEFEVVQEYEIVSCYASFDSSPWMRIPESGFFETTDQFHWNIEEYLGGVNSVVIPAPINHPLNIKLKCVGMSNCQSNNIGDLDVSHPPADWNGQIIQGSGEGGEGFTISYRINPLGSDLSEPIQLNEISWNQQKYLHWIWGGDPAEINGFRIYRNDVLVASVSPELRLHQMAPWWTVPPCGEEYQYYVVAYRGTMESLPSNTLGYQGDSCKGHNEIKKILSEELCGGTGRRFGVRYKYQSSHGQASIGIRVFKNGDKVDQIFTTHPQIQHGEGAALIALTYHGQEPITTDKVMVYMLDENGRDFYVENFNQTIEWTPGMPDLIIESAEVDRENHTLNVRIRNDGCGGTAVEPDLKIVREADGWTGFENLQEDLPAKTGSLITVDFPPEEAGLWGGKITLTVDPFNKIEESGENNNDYQIGSARIEAVQFYKIYIYDDHEARDSNKGEWNICFVLHQIYDEGWGPYWGTCRDYQWGEGEHSINNLYIYPTLEDNDKMSVRVHAAEDDPWSLDFCGEVKVYHSPDGTHSDLYESKGYKKRGSWKGGGEFSELSDYNDYIIYYRIILE